MKQSIIDYENGAIIEAKLTLINIVDAIEEFESEENWNETRGIQNSL